MADLIKPDRLNKRTAILPPIRVFENSRPETWSMAETQFRFDDGAAYERHMGTWSRLAGEIFLDWLAPDPGLRWVDIGCGNGAFSELIVERCAPAEVQGVDPSEGQLAFARTRPAARLARFQQGDAMALPFADSSFDAAVMALVIFFVPDPAKGLSEMVRVVRPGGTMTAYAWDLFGGGFPLEPIGAELRAMNIRPFLPPSPDASRTENLRALWTQAGATDVEMRVIKVERTFASFDEFWNIAMTSNVRMVIDKMSASDAERLKARVRERLPADGTGRITFGAHANAIKGRVTK
jgi:SAM-dependent methyltransferase